MDFLKNKLWIFVLIGLCSCNTEGHRGSSDSIEDSKQRGTFIGQYKVDFTPDSTANVIGSKIDEVFIEYSWFVKSPQSIIDTTCINIVIKTSESNVDILTTEYQIGLDSESNFSRHSKNTLWFFSANENSFDKLSVTDSITFKVHKGEKYLGDVNFIRDN
jgi:hypothetical protein